MQGISKGSWPLSEELVGIYTVVCRTARWNSGCIRKFLPLAFSTKFSLELFTPSGKCFGSSQAPSYHCMRHMQHSRFTFIKLFSVLLHNIQFFFPNMWFFNWEFNKNISALISSHFFLRLQSLFFSPTRTAMKSRRSLVTFQKAMIFFSIPPKPLPPPSQHEIKCLSLNPSYFFHLLFYWFLSLPLLSLFKELIYLRNWCYKQNFGTKY